MKAVLFDFNGTLFLDTQYHIDTWKKYLKDTLDLDFTDEDFKCRIWGKDNNAIARDLYGCSNHDEIMKISEDKEKKYRELCSKDKISLVKGATSFFDELKKRKIPFTIVTGAIKSNVDFYFERFELSKWFDYDLVVYDDGYLPGKPDPTVYLMGADKLNVKAEDCIVVEDSIAGVIAAKRAGVKEIYVLGEKKNFDEEVTAFIHDFDELKKILKLETVSSK